MKLNRNNLNELEGYVLTPQRQLILETIHESDGPVDARKLFNLVSKKDETVSLATVYRSLKLFKEVGLIDEHRFGKSCWSYEVKQSLEHQHIICRICGRIIVFESPLITEIIKGLQEQKGFTIDRVEVCVQGVCSECQQKSSHG